MPFVGGYNLNITKKKAILHEMTFFSKKKL